jgi:hypothetical protein
MLAALHRGAEALPDQCLRPLTVDTALVREGQPPVEPIRQLSRRLDGGAADRPCP